MKQLRLVLLVLISFVVMSAKSQNVGDEFKSGQLYYEVTSESEVSVARQHSSKEVTGDIIIPETVSYEGKKYRVVAIGEYAFAFCEGLTSVTIPTSIKEISKWAFVGCTRLTFVTIPNSVEKIGSYAFSSCEGLTSVTISNSVKEIGRFAFDYCLNLTSVTIPNSVKEIGEAPFRQCRALREIKVAEGNSSFKSVDGVLFNVGMTQLIQCPAAKKGDSYVIPNSVKMIGEEAFSYCTALTAIIIPSSVEEIGQAAFGHCEGLTSIMLPNSVKVMDIGAFAYCLGLTSITIPNSVEEISGAPFFVCPVLTEIQVAEGNSSFKSIDGVLFNAGMTQLIQYPAGKENDSYEIPNSVREIGPYAIAVCLNLISVTIPNSVKEIEEGAFWSCSSLKTVRSKIKEPNSVTLGKSVFNEVDTKACTLQVPKGSKALYQAAEQWSAFANIEEVDYSATTAIRTSETKVWSEDGTIYISSGECGADGTASVYTPSGTLVAVIPLQEGANKLSIASGAYLVQVAGETYKVQVL